MLIRRTRSLIIFKSLLGCTLLIGLSSRPLTGQTSTVGGVAPSTFAGISLTASQLAQLQALTAATRQQQRAALGAVKPGQALDSIARATLQRLAMTHAQATRQLLTPSQQAQLAANEQALSASRAHARGKATADSLGGR